MSKTPGFKQTMDLLSELHNVSETSVDIETRAKSTVLTSIAFTIYPPSWVAFAIPFDGRYFKEDEERELIEAIDYLLTVKKVPVIGANFLYDWSVLYWLYGIKDINLYFDIQVAQHLIYADLPRSLEYISSYYLDYKHHKWLASEDLGIYNIADVVTTHAAKQELEKVLIERGCLDIFHEIMSWHRPIMEMEQAGLKIDVEGVKNFRLKAGDKIRELQEILNKQVGYELNPRSPKQVADHFYRHKKLPAYKSKTGGESTDNIALQRLARKGYAEADTIRDIRYWSKLKGTYLEIPYDYDYRLRCQVKICGTSTGRLATATNPRGTGTNLQNLHPELKKYVIPDEGYVFLEFDFGQAENRIMAMLSNDRILLEAFAQDKDIHTLTASEILNINIEDVTPELRKLGKRLNHGINYDIGYKTFALNANLLEKDGKYYLEKWHAKHPWLRWYFKKIKDQLKKDRTVYNLFGRPRTFLTPLNDVTFRAAYDYIPQSTVGQMCNRSLKQIYGDSTLDFIRLAMQVHDSILVQVPNDMNLILESCDKISQHMYYVLKYEDREMFIPVDVSIGVKSWGQKVEANSLDSSDIKDAYLQAGGTHTT